MTANPETLATTLPSGVAHGSRGRVVVHYVLALGAVAVALGVRALLDRWLGDYEALTLLLGAIGAAVWVGGAGPAVLAAVVGYFAFDFYFVEPRGSFALLRATPRALAAFSGYALASALVIGFGARLRHLRHELERDVVARERAQKALEARDRRIRVATEAARLGLFVWDVRSNRVASENARSFEIFGRKSGDPPLDRDTFIERFVHPEDRAQFVQCIERGMQDGEPLQLEMRIRRQDDYEWRWITFSGQFEIDAEGRPVQLVGVAGDITERRQAEEALRSNEAQLRLITDALPVLVAYVDTEHRYRFSNLTYEHWFGHRREDIVGRHVRDVLGDAAYEAILPAMRRALAGGSLRFEARLAYRDGGPRDVEVQYMPHRVDGRVLGYVSLVEDVSERRHDEDARAHLAAIVQSSDDAIIGLTPEGIVTSWNAGARRLYGYTPEEMVGASISRIIPEELRGEELRILAQLSRGERIDHYETERLCKDGRRVIVSLTVSPIRDRTGRIAGASKVARDVTERKRSEEHRELLLRELAHRVKNTLAVVQSLASQTLRRAGSLESFGATFTGRLAALAAVHDLLLGTRWEGVELRDLAERTLAPHGAPERFFFDGPVVHLSANAAVSFSMALHELATNATKYGALSRPGGRIEFTWRRVGAPARVALEWRERGGPAVSAPAASGFGSRLIDSVSRELGGEVALEWAPEGLVCRIELPLGEHLQSPEVSALRAP